MHQISIGKISIMITLLHTSLYSASLSSAEITKMVNEIKKEREGIGLVMLNNTANPFIIYIPEEKVPEASFGSEVVNTAPVEVKYMLKAILNNAAFIDKKWYKRGDSLGNYKIGYISSTSVVLNSSAGERVLKLNQKKKKFIKLNRGHK
ncbi:MAG: Unknown protein [uncultured Sulfurovum sp.]|uniref:Uncharacterized protein n=1 Tax=uncultured Sulfurovum sp. TaxID=269237 RepID=A0A6S6TZU9_9BACT|nr:MAG: Unknown protein [uncultured Sulfurovum sp.]